MKKIYKIIFSKFAEDDLIEITEYYKNLNIESCKSLFLAIEDKVNKLKVNQLKEFPSHGRIVPELEDQNINDYRELIEGNYPIIYSIQENSIFIHTIVDSRRNLEELIIKKLIRYY